MRKTPKRIFVLTLLLVLFLTGLYFQRVQVATLMINAALKQSGYHILALDALKIGWRGLGIRRLEVGIGREHIPQVLEELELTYSVLEARPRHLIVQRASLQLPPASEEPAAPLLLTELMQQFFSLPLESLEFRAISIPGIPLVQPPLFLAAKMGADSLALKLRDTARTTLELSLGDGGPGRVSGDLRLAMDGAPVLTLTARLQPTGEQLQLTGSGRVDAGALADFVAPVAPLPPPLSALRGDIPFTLATLLDNDLNSSGAMQGKLTLPAGAVLAADITVPGLETTAASLLIDLVEPLAVAAGRDEQGRVQVALAADKIALSGNESRGTASGTLSALRCQLDSMPSCSGEVQLAAGIPELELAGEPPTRLAGMQLGVAFNFELAEALTLRWQPGRLLYSERLQRGDLLLRQVALVADSPGELVYQLEQGKLTVRSDRASLLLPRVKLPDLNLATRLDISALNLSRDAGESIVADLRLTADSINLQRPGGWLPALGLDSSLALAGEQLSAAGRIYSDRRKPLFAFSALHQLHSGSGAAQVSTDGVSFDPAANRLSNYFSHWPFDLDIYQGALTTECGLDWQQTADRFQLQARLSNRLENLAGIYGDLGFIGLSGAVPLQFTSTRGLYTTADALLTLDQLDVGVPLESLSARFRLDTAGRELQLQKVEARIFDGRLWTENTVYRADRPANRIDVGVDGLELEQLLDLAGYDAVEGSGRISGLLPLNIGTAGITMHRGMLAARAPGGVFRYRAEMAPGTNPAMAQAMQALSNYHYSVFQTEADYLDSGDLELSMTLRGHNPDMDQSRPIHLNLSVTDNIPMLLKSLRAGRAVADTVSRKVSGAP